jgi:hypothetical protein
VRRIVVWFAAAMFLLLLASPAYAQRSVTDICDSSGGVDTKNSIVCASNIKSNSKNPITVVIKNVTNLVALATGITSVIFIIVGSIKMIVSAGDSNAVSAAKRTVLYAVIGLVVAALAEGIVVFVLGNLK